MDQKAFSAKLDAIAGLVVEMYAMLDDAPVVLDPLRSKGTDDGKLERPEEIAGMFREG